MDVKQCLFRDKEQQEIFMGIMLNSKDIICGHCGTLIPFNEYDTEDCPNENVNFTLLGVIEDEWEDFSTLILEALS